MKNKKFFIKHPIIQVFIIAILFFTTSYVIAAATTEAKIIFDSGYNLDNFLNNLKRKKSSKDQIYAMNKYTKPITKNEKYIKLNDQYAINNFIVYGSASTQKISALERYNLLKQYKTKYKKLPINENDWNNLLKSIEQKSSNMELDIRFTKSSYVVGDSLAGSDYYLKYKGQSFKGLIIYTQGNTHAATRGIIKTGDFDNPETMPAMKANIYSINAQGEPNPFTCNGQYKYGIAVYSCSVVDKIFKTNDCGQGGWPPSIELTSILTHVSPLKKVEKTIIVNCPDGQNSCCNNGM